MTLLDGSADKVVKTHRSAASQQDKEFSAAKQL